jgi:beta-glucanase (GH16 family)
MNVRRGGVVSAIVLIAAAMCNRPTSATSQPPQAHAVPAPSWSDEFDGPRNAPPDPGRWTYDIGASGWGNRELQTYTASAQNVHLDGQGHLVIHVESTASGFTSARLKTKGLFAAQFGRVEARIKLPSGQGIWPAFWMLGIDGRTWPDCGEIDVMENIGREPDAVHGTVHGPGYSGAKGITATFALPNHHRFADDFHTFTIQWAPQTISFYVDDVRYHTVTPASLPAGAPWVFDHPFFLLLNVAVGGNFPGAPDATTQFPQEMLVDYVRYVPLAR